MTTNPQKFKILPGTVEAMQFDGKNGKDLRAWVDDTQTEYDQSIRVGGGWVKLSTEYFGDDSVLKKGDMLLLLGSGISKIFAMQPLEEFVANYKIEAKHDLDLSRL
jgi:hypothetical protein